MTSSSVASGIYPAMLTPFKSDNSIDWSALDDIAAHLRRESANWP